MDNHGRILIPASLRKELNYKKGDTFVLRVINNELRIISLENAIKEIQGFMKQYIKPGTSMVDEFLEMRRQEYELEEEKYRKYNE